MIFRNAENPIFGTDMQTPFWNNCELPAADSAAAAGLNELQ